MSIKIVRGATLLIPSYIPGNPDHLHVVMCDPNLVGQVLLVSICTYNEEKRDHDSTCLLDKGDHPFIKHRSYVRYASAEIRRASNLKNMTGKGFINEMVFQKILDGFYVSRHAGRFVFEYLPKPSPFN